MDNRTLDSLRWRVALGTGVFAIVPTMLLVILLSGVAETGLETGSRFSGPVVPLLIAWPLLAAGGAFGVATYFTRVPPKTTMRAKIAAGLTLAGLLVFIVGIKSGQ